MPLEFSYCNFKNVWRWREIEREKERRKKKDIRVNNGDF
jgi:hypothetical protein